MAFRWGPQPDRAGPRGLDRPSCLVLNVPLGPEAIYNTVQIIGDLVEGQHPYTTFRSPIGTGFLVAVFSSVPNTAHVYVVTAAHVIKDQPIVDVQAIGVDGTPFPVRRMSGWSYHPNRKVDVAVAPFGEFPGISTQPSVLPFDQMTSPDRTPPAIGNTVHYIGLLAGLNIPMARTGTVGAAYQEGLHFAGGWDYKGHLIDCRSFGGFSGSPVYYESFFPRLKPMDELPWPREDGEPPTGSIVFVQRLIGMFTAHFDQAGMFEEEDGTTFEMSSRHGVGIVLPIDYIREVIHGRELVENRKQRDDELRAGAGPETQAWSDNW
jgi:hypothetical protein